MAFVNGLGSKEIQANYNDDNLQDTVRLKLITYGGYVLGCPKFGTFSTEGLVEPELALVTQRNSQVEAYWASQGIMCNSVLNYGRNSEEPIEFARFLCNGHDIFAAGLYGLPGAVGRMMTTASTERDFMKAAIVGQDLATALVTNQPVKPLSEILARTPDSDKYDIYWSDGNFVPDVAWLAYYDVTAYDDLINPTRPVGSDT